MARPRKPTSIKDLQGTLRTGRTPENEPVPEGVAECPEFLSSEARAEWARIAPELERIGLLSSVDVAVFANYCQAWSDFRKLTEQLNGMASWVWQSEKGYRQAVPEVALRKDAWVRLAGAASKLGLDPSSRSGLNVPIGSGRPKKNKFSGRGLRVS